MLNISAADEVYRTRNWCIGEECSRFSNRRLGLVTLTRASWNHVTGWLRQIDNLRGLAGLAGRSNSLLL
jgi:hypothetical protein